MAISAPTSMENNRGGNGRHTPLKRRPKNGQVAEADKPAYLKFRLDMYDRRDLRQRFKGSKDPVYMAFDFVDRQSVGQLAMEFVKDSFFDITNFVSKVATALK